jgi:hypothetical protein
MILISKDTYDYNLSLELVFPTFIMTKDSTQFLSKKFTNYSHKEMSFNTCFLLTLSDEYIRMDIKLLGFGIVFKLLAKDNYEDEVD